LTQAVVLISFPKDSKLFLVAKEPHFLENSSNLLVLSGNPTALKWVKGVTERLLDAL
jgi:hypothetical protein